MSGVGRGAARATFARFFVPVFAVLAYLGFRNELLNDGDTFWHIRTGEWILAHGSVPRSDPFSYTFAGKPWHAHEWLAEVFYALAYRGGGWPGVILLTALAVGVAIGFVHLVARRNLSWGWAAGATFLAFYCLAPHILARPHVMGLAMLAAWSWVLLTARRAGHAPPLWTLALIALWTNLHGSVLFGLGLTAVFAFDALVETPGQAPRVIREWAVFGIGAGLAALLNPRGLDGLLFLLQLTRMESLAGVAEWMPPSFAKLNGLQLLLGAGVLALLTRGVRVPLVRALLLLGMVWLTLNHQRHQMLVAITGTMIVCEAIGAMRADNAGVAAPRWLGWAAALGVVVLSLIRLTLPAQPIESERNPASALVQVPADLRQQPVLNDYGAGGFLVWHGVRPFIDGRTDMYGDAFMARYQGAINQPARKLDPVLQAYGVKWTFLETGSDVVAEMDRRSGWERIYADRFITVHRRK